MSGDLVADVIAAAADRLGPDATAVLERLAGSLGDAARASARELARLDESARKQHRAQAAAIVRSPTLAAVRGVHPTWIEASLADLPARTRTALVGESAEPTDVWLARWATAMLPPMPPPSSRPTLSRDADLAQILARDPAQIAAWLTSIALDQFAFALGPAAAAAGTASPHAARALGDAAARITHAPRLDALGPQRAALERCRGAALDDDAALLGIAGRALAPHLADHPIARLRLTRRLPYAQGIVVERELVAHAATALDRAPTWAALVAP